MESSWSSSDKLLVGSVGKSSMSSGMESSWSSNGNALAWAVGKLSMSSAMESSWSSNVLVGAARRSTCPSEAAFIFLLCLHVWVERDCWDPRTRPQSLHLKMSVLNSRSSPYNWGRYWENTKDNAMILRMGNIFLPGYHLHCLRSGKSNRGPRRFGTCHTFLAPESFVHKEKAKCKWIITFITLAVAALDSVFFRFVSESSFTTSPFDIVRLFWGSFDSEWLCFRWIFRYCLLP